MVLTEAEGSNQAVDRLPYCVTPGPKRPIISRRLTCQRHAACLEDLQVQQPPLHLFRDNVVADTLQHFAANPPRL